MIRQFSVDKIHEGIKIPKVEDPGIGKYFFSSDGEQMPEVFVKVASPKPLDNPSSNMLDMILFKIKELDIIEYGLRSTMVEYVVDDTYKYMYAVLLGYRSSHHVKINR